MMERGTAGRVEAALACLEAAEAVLEEVCAERRIPAPQLDALLERLAAIADLIDAEVPGIGALPAPFCRWLH